VKKIKDVVTQLKEALLKIWVGDKRKENSLKSTEMHEI
jgi:hypothetical protein